MSLNPYETVLSINIRRSRRLLGVLGVITVLACGSVLLSERLGIWRLPLLLLCILYATHEMQRYGLGFRLPLLSRNRRAQAIIGIQHSPQHCLLRLADGSEIPARMRMPIRRWRWLLMLRFQLLSSHQPRTLCLVLTPWQMDADSFRLMYSRLGWARDERSDVSAG